MKSILLLLMLLSGVASAQSGIDGIIGRKLSEKGIEPSEQSDPARLARRYYLVVTDRIPTEAQTRAFLRNPDKAALVDSLLASDGFVEKQVLKWGDLLRIKSEFPSCMWPNAVQAFNKWLTEEFRANRPYNLFVKDMLSAAGSNFRTPQTNFYRAGSDRSPAKFTSDIALLFMGYRHAPESWQPFFSQIRFKSTKEWKEEILCINIDVLPPAETIQLGGRQIELQEGTDYRLPFIDWLTSADNRQLARAYANRLWSWLMGSGIVNPVDDMEDNRASNSELLDYLTDSFVKSGYDVRALAREILLSDAFTRSTISNKSNKSDRRYFSHYLQSRLTAEQICDAICDITEVPDKYSSRAPEPFTNFPSGTRANQVCDGTITTPQLDIFGRPSRDVALESSRDNSLNAKQILYLLNSTTIQEKLKSSPYIERALTNFDTEKFIRDAYMRVIARPASDAEVEAVSAWASRIKSNNRNRIIAESVIWALINSNEFIFLN